LIEVLGLAYLRDEEVVFTEPRPFLTTLDDVPFAAFDLLRGREQLNIPVMTNTVGCPFDCTFCYKDVMAGRGYIVRPVDEAVKYLKHAYRFTRRLWWTGGKKTIFLGDDNIAANQKWAIKFFQEAARLGYRDLVLTCQMRASACRNDELMNAVKAAGVSTIFFGFESTSDDDLIAMSKRQTGDDITHAIQACKKRGIGVNAMIIWGLEGHQPGDHLKYVDFLLEHGVEALFLFMFTPLPGTPDGERIRQASFMLDVPTRFFDLQHIVFKHPNMTPLQAQMAHLEALESFYSLRQTWSDVRSGKISWHSALYRIVGWTSLPAARSQAHHYNNIYLLK